MEIVKDEVGEDDKDIRTERNREQEEWKIWTRNQWNEVE